MRIDIDIIGMDRVCSARDRWRAAYRKNGVDGLHDNRAGKSGRAFIHSDQGTHYTPPRCFFSSYLLVVKLVHKFFLMGP
jgi:hypothetical protein